jgi:molybdate transport system substrate-binding protein
VKTLDGFLRRLVLGLFALFALPLPAGADETAPPEITVFAAASLTNVMQEIGASFRADTGIPVRLSFAASSALARQVESGAPVQAFVSADLEWMDYLARHGLIDVASRRNVAGNALVLIAPADSTVALEIAPGFALAATLGDRRLAVADPASVPAGRYAKAALTALKAWDSLRGKLAPAESVRAALALVSRGEAPLGIVYRTDASVDPKVKIVGAFPAGTHPPIVYPAAAMGGSVPGAEFVAYLTGEKAQAAFRRYGFSAAR